MKRTTISLSLLALAFSLPVFADHGMAPARRNAADIQYSPIPGLPTCATGAVQSGDPSKGGSIIASRVEAGCTIPWHWHTPSEHLMMVSGTARIEMKGEPAFTLEPGGYAMMPSKHQHQLTCTATCMFYVEADAAFDIHYVNASGSEISPDDALKAVKETTVAPSK